MEEDRHETRDDDCDRRRRSLAVDAEHERLGTATRYPRQNGKEFIYPKDQALRIAAAAHQPVLATDTDVAKGGEANVFVVEPNGTAAEGTNASASGNSNQQQAATEPAPAPVATTGTYDANPAPRQQASNELPKTASPFQLIGLMGLISLAGAFGLRLARGTN